MKDREFLAIMTAIIFAGTKGLDRKESLIEAVDILDDVDEICD